MRKPVKVAAVVASLASIGLIFLIRSTSWLAAQPAPHDMTPLPGGAMELPAPCGSVER